MSPSARTISDPPDRFFFGLYSLTLLVGISIWFIAVRAPLWLDETISYWQIRMGFSQILSRLGGLSFPAYPFILWLSTKILGTSELALRISSIPAMLVAASLLFRAAQELFSTDIAFVVAVVFSIHPFIIFEAVDVRPYAFATLAVSSAILLLLRSRHNRSHLLAALFGISAALVVYFHFLFSVILPVLATFFFFSNAGGGLQKRWQQIGTAFGVFAVAFLPVIPGLLYMLKTRETHVFADPPKLVSLAFTLAPGFLPHILAITILAAAVTRKIDLSRRVDGWCALFCASLAFFPILTLYGVSTLTPLHVFVERYRLVAIPGIALSWGLILNRVDSRLIRLLFCVAVVATSAYHYFSSPTSATHGYTWKYALEIAEKNAASDNAPVVICSDLVEADYAPMPVGDAVKDSPFFAPLSYYPLNVPVVGLPRALNSQAQDIGMKFVHQAGEKHQRFLAMAYYPSYNTLQWLVSAASGTHTARMVGGRDDIIILEFTPYHSPGAFARP